MRLLKSVEVHLALLLDIYACSRTIYSLVSNLTSNIAPQIEYQNTQEASIPHAAYTGTGTELFDFIARTVASFISAEKKQATPLANGNGAAVKEGGEAQEKEKALPVLGFCFSFAMEQTAVNAGGRSIRAFMFARSREIQMSAACARLPL